MGVVFFNDERRRVREKHLEFSLVFQSYQTRCLTFTSVLIANSVGWNSTYWFLPSRVRNSSLLSRMRWPRVLTEDRPAVTVTTVIIRISSLAITVVRISVPQRRSKRLRRLRLFPVAPRQMEEFAGSRQVTTSAIIGHRSFDTPPDATWVPQVTPRTAKAPHPPSPYWTRIREDIRRSTYLLLRLNGLPRR